MAKQAEASRQTTGPRTSQASRWLPIAWASANLAIGLLSYVPLLLGYITVQHYLGTPDHDLELPGLGLAGLAFVLLVVGPVFIWANKAFTPRLGFPRGATWAGASILTLGPSAFGILFPSAANSMWYYLFN